MRLVRDWSSFQRLLCHLFLLLMIRRLRTACSKKGSFFFALSCIILHRCSLTISWRQMASKSWKINLLWWCASVFVRCLWRPFLAVFSSYSEFLFTTIIFAKWCVKTFGTVRSSFEEQIVWVNVFESHRKLLKMICGIQIENYGNEALFLLIWYSNLHYMS